MHKFTASTALPTGRLVERSALAGELRDAIAADELTLYVQPKVSLATGELTSVEALVRWIDGERGQVRPDEFLPLAERDGLIRPLTDMVLRQAIAACAEWQSELPGVGIAVNLSPTSLADESLVDRVRFLLRRFRLRPDLLTLEISESSIRTDPVRVLDRLYRLHRYGVKLSIDDFGAGRSSLAYLQRLPVQEVKIDRTFVAKLAAAGDKTAISRAIDLAKELSLDVVGERIESLGDWDVLRELDCSFGQGYLIAHPMPMSVLTHWHAGWRQPRRALTVV